MENKELLLIMERCGHFLYHRRGGKRGQVKILKSVYEKGSITQKELLENLKIKSGSVSETVKKLENQGFINKERDKEDKRKVIITLTEEGKEFLDRELSVTREQEKNLFDALSGEEQEELRGLLEKLFEDWKGRFDGELFKHRG